MRTVIVGGVAGGMSAATRLRRLQEESEIIVLEKGEHVSFANCGLPYYAGGVIESREELLLQTPEGLRDRFNLDVRTLNEAVKIDPDMNIVHVKDHRTGNTYDVQYDNLILSQGATPFVPEIPGKEKMLTLRNVFDVDIMKEKIDEARLRSGKAVVIGAGFIGLEMAENLRHAGLDVALVELSEQVLPPLDRDMAFYVEEELKRHGVELFLGSSATEITDTHVFLSDGTHIPADMVVGSIGVRPETALAQTAGLELGSRGGVVVDDMLRTSVKNIYAVGDMAEKNDVVTQTPSLVALANTANKQGRRVADVISGRDVGSRSADALGTAVVQVFDITVAMTGASSRRLEVASMDYASIHTHPKNHAGYYPGSETMHLVVHFDPSTGRILGAQGVGPQEVARRIDVLATAIFTEVSAADLIDIELAYSPQHGSAKDAINMIGYIADGYLNHPGESISPYSLDNYILEREGLIIDVRTLSEYEEGHIPGAINIPLDEMRARLHEIEEVPLVVACQVGQRGHSAARMLSQYGHDVRNLDGGYETWKALHAATR